MKEIPIEAWKYIIIAFIITSGAIVHATAQLKMAREDDSVHFTTTDFFILIPIAMFSGWIFAIMGSMVLDSANAIYLCAGIGSFLGIAGINKISQTFLEVATSKIKNNGE